MFATWLIRTILMVLALLVAVPAFTGGAVAVRRGGLLRGLLVYLGLAIVNDCLWLGIGILTAGGVIVANWLLFGLVGLLIYGLAFLTLGKLMPNTLKVDSYGSGFWAAVTMTAMSIIIHMLV